jgi:septum formation protein
VKKIEMDIRYKIILGSQSIRRQKLLQKLNIDLEIRTADIDESFPSDLEADTIPEYIAKQKAKALRHSLKTNELLITADTIVILDSEIYGKPQNFNHAVEMLKRLSGRTHKVITGICFTTLDKQKLFSVATDVTFSKLDDYEIEYYINKYKPYDKAGSYGIQDWIGFVGVEKIDGSFYNVMGLPIQTIYKELKRFDNE